MRITSNNNNSTVENSFPQETIYSLIKQGVSCEEVERRLLDPFFKEQFLSEKELFSLANQRSDHLQLIELFLRYGADVDQYYEEAKSCNKEKEFCELVLQEMLIEKASPEMRTLLLLKAIECGNNQWVEGLFKQGVSPNLSDTKIMKTSCLHMAINKKNLELIQLLLAHDADIHCEVSGITPLMQATGDNQIFSLFENKIKDFKKVLSNRGWTLLHSAAFNNNHELIKRLIKEHDFSIDEKPVESCVTPLFIAVFNNCFEAAKKLLELGADPNILCKMDHEEYSAFTQAVLHGKENMMELLLGFKANINQLSKEGYAPLHFAVKINKKLVDFLLSRGANVHVRNSLGQTPLMQLLTSWIEESEKAETIKTLISYGADPFLIDPSKQQSAPQLMILKKENPKPLYEQQISVFKEDYQEFRKILSYKKMVSNYEMLLKNSREIENEILNYQPTQLLKILAWQGKFLKELYSAKTLFLNFAQEFETEKFEENTKYFIPFAEATNAYSLLSDLPELIPFMIKDLDRIEKNILQNPREMQIALKEMQNNLKAISSGFATLFIPSAAQAALKGINDVLARIRSLIDKASSNQTLKDQSDFEVYMEDFNEQDVFILLANWDPDLKKLPKKDYLYTYGFQTGRDFLAMGIDFSLHHQLSLLEAGQKSEFNFICDKLAILNRGKNEFFRKAYKLLVRNKDNLPISSIKTLVIDGCFAKLKDFLNMDETEVLNKLGQHESWSKYFDAAEELPALLSYLSLDKTRRKKGIFQ